MGWSHIPDFDLSCGKDLECCNNPWKGKNPKPTSKIYVALPSDWLCNKIEKLNFEVTEGYPRSQESGGLKMDRFIALQRLAMWN